MNYMIDRKLFEIVKQALGISYLKEYPDKFSTRLIVQKALYLLTHGSSSPKANLSYKWNFYLHGPYSPEISHMIYHMHEVWDEISNKEIQLGQEELLSIENFKGLKRELDGLNQQRQVLQDLKVSEVFEVLATLTYLAGQIGDKKKIIQEKFKKFKPELDEKIPTEGFEQLLSLLRDKSYI